MRRVVSVWFPHWPTDRLRRHRARLGAEVPPGPLVTARHNGRRWVVAATDAAAFALGLRPGFAMVHALTLVPGLHVAEAELQADADALRRLALWCHRYTPLVAVDGTAGLWLDVTGCAGPFGTEEALLRHMVVRFEANGFQARAALADTPGAAHALARFGPPLAVAPPGSQCPAVASLPVASLRLGPDIDAALRRLGFACVGDLSRVPRAVLTRRFGSSLVLRLDQVRGHAREPLMPLLPELVLQRRIAFPEPLLIAEILHAAAGHLVGSLCQAMERDGVGARRLDLMFEHVDRGFTAIRIGTVRASRDARHLLRLLQERFASLDPGEGIEAMHLLAPLTNPLRWTQQDGTGTAHVAPLVDRLVNRLGQDGVYCAAPIHTAIPERMIGKGAAMDAMGRVIGKRQPVATPPVPPPDKAATRLVVDRNDPGQESMHDAFVSPRARLSLSLVTAEHPVPASGLTCWANATSGSSIPSSLEGPAEEQPLPWKPRPLRSKEHALSLKPWPGHHPAPLRLLAPPRPVQVLAELPNQPPRAFTWRRHRHLVRRADGPERIDGEWWRTDSEAGTVRDYFLVEDEGGQRFWLFRQGDGLHLRTGTLDWFLHGLF